MRLIKTYKHETLDEHIDRLIKYYTKNGYQQVEAGVSEVDGRYHIAVFGHKETRLNPLRHDLINIIKRTNRTARGVSIALNMSYGTFYHYVRGKARKDETYRKLIDRIKKYYNLRDSTATDLVKGIQKENK